MKRREFLKGAALVTWASIWGVVPSSIIKPPALTVSEQEGRVEDKEEVRDYGPHPYFLEGGWAQPLPIEFTYTLLNANTSLPLSGVSLFFTSDADGVNVVWAGTTNVFGEAHDAFGESPRLDRGKYWAWQKPDKDNAILIDVVFNY